MDILKKHIGAIIFSVVVAIIGVACSIVPYFAVASIVTQLINGATDYRIFLPYAGLIFAGFAGAIIGHSVSTIGSHNLAFSIIEDTRKRVVEKLSRLSMGTIEEKSSGKWSQFVVETVDKMEKPIAHVIPEVLANVIIPIVIVVIIFILNWKIALANLVTLPLGMLFSMLMMKDYEAKSKRYIEASKKMNAAAVEYIQGIKVIKAFNKSASSYDKFQKAVEDNRDSMLDWYLSVCFAMTAAMEVLPSTLLVVLPVGLYLFMTGGITLPVLIMCVLLSYASYKPLLKAMAYMDTMANVRVVFGEIQSVLDLPELVRQDTAPAPHGFDVRFENVVFGYGGALCETAGAAAKDPAAGSAVNGAAAKDSTKVFDGLNFTAKEGELTAIVGSSGSGKSTIAKLLAGFWNIDSGHITIGGADIGSMSLERNMQLVTYVSQENFLFNKTIRENLKMAKEDATDAEIEAACTKASIHDFIKSLPDGYDTNAGNAGSKFSGGERQRLTIARALLKDSPIVVLDEATAYSDPENEAIIQQSIDNLVKNKTVIMIAHRLSTIVNADKIIVLDKGKIAAEGTHTELLQRSPLYQKMWQSHISSRDN
ncbi:MULTISPECIES: ABC transporter ATP-binding protein [unclassified Treponema]|uniref:ABC transporter ATP-binding protein n=1 Tax=unclassified Treponema TaxID=2638727 RepID=UPI000530133B|nr:MULTISPECIES: ABC transporter ATP-binding protein [unclassified Treponema]AIW90222.1 ABC transporter ATP-binding protein [Treponema sp. OMZ 838]UTC43643.1 ABC transporter ATP-binding protein [Treponema sp. OMZ 857]